MELSERCAERLGIGLLGFTGSWLLDVAISLKPGAIVSASITLTCLTCTCSIRLPVYTCYTYEPSLNADHEDALHAVAVLW